MTLCGLILFIVMMYLRPAEIQITDKAVDLGEIMPIEMISEDIIVNGNGDLTIGYKMFLPEVFTLSEEEVKHIHSRLEGLFKMLPAGTAIHQQNFYYTDKHKSKDFSLNPLMAENLKHHDGKDILNSYTNLYVTFVNTKNTKSKVRKNAADTSLMRRFNYPYKQPFRDLQSRIEEIDTFVMNFENGLSSINKFDIIRMRDAELNNAVFDYVNLSYNMPTMDATKESVNPMTVTSQGDFKIGDQFVSLLTLTTEGEHLNELKAPNTGKTKSFVNKIELPENIKSKCSMLYPLGLGLPFDHIVNVVIEITDTDSTVTAVKSERDALNSIANFYPPAKDKQRDQDLFCQEIADFDYQTSITAFNVVINDTDRSALVRKTSLVSQGYSFMNQSSCYLENAELANLFFCNIPGNARSNYRGFINTTKQALCYLQKENMYISSLTGHIYHDRFGKPSKVDLWNYPSLNNKNRIVIGPSGSGKSFWLNDYILQSYVMGKDIMIIDIGGSYKSMINLNGGKYFDSQNQKQFAFNPFLCETDKNGRYIYLDYSDDESTDDHINTIVAILSYIWRKNEPMTQAETALLRRSIISFYEYVNNSSVDGTSERIFPNLIEYRKYLNEVFSEKMSSFEKSKFEVEELVLLLERYTTGELAFLLNATENVDIVHDRLIAFDMEDASKKDYFPLVAIITLQMVIDKIKKRQGIAKELIIDEALDFLQDEKFGSFIAYLYRTFRKKEGSITLAAQNVLFLKNIPAQTRDSIIINCATKIILDHSEHRSNLPDIRDILSISEDSISMIESLQKREKWREFFILLANDPFVFRTEVSDFAAAAYDSRQSTVVRIRQLFKETGSTYTAINRYLEERRSKYA